VPEWRIYYSNETTFDSDQGEPHDAPSEGFLCAIGYDETGKRYIMHGWTFYQWDTETNQWWGMDQFGLFDRLRRNLVYAYKEGRTVSRKRWEEIMVRANNDPDFPIGGRK
jgi:hypothetical protein